MRSDLDRLMLDRQLDVVIVTGGENENPLLHYLTNGAAVTSAIAVKPQGAPFTLLVNAMETEEAAKSGLTIMATSAPPFEFAALLKEADGSRSKAEIALWGRVLHHFAPNGGRIGLYGVGAIQHYAWLIDTLRQVYPAYTFIGESGMTLFDEAMITKDEAEIAQMRRVAVLTHEVLAAVWDFIAGHRAHEGTVVKPDGAPLTIGEVKRFIRRALLDRGLEENGTIFAQGRDGGFPHSRGEADDVLRVGQAIVFDLFPREAGGGYYHDCTRTWSIGHAAPAVQTAYDLTMQAFNAALDECEVGAPTAALQNAACDVYEAAGHPTQRTHPGTTVGYVHSLGHGVGLNIHERPSLHHLSKDEIARGQVFSIEPGLYYPDQGFGVRIEDLVVMNLQGELENLTTFHKRLIVPLTEV